MTPPLSGRRAEAARNDELVLEAARKVLIASPDAPMAQIADRAGVGIGTLYRRYPSKEALVTQLCLDAMEQLEKIALAAVERARTEPWAAFVDFVDDSFDAGAGGLGPSLAGTFTPSAELMAVSRSMGEAAAELVAIVQEAGELRTDVTAAEIGLLFEMVRAVSIGGEERSAALQHRYLALMLEALRAPGAGPLPAPPPTWQEISTRWSG
jgi:AcrR family transcriptional regulator